jgi:hypothetical protein
MPTKLYMAEKRTRTKMNRMIDVSSVILELMNLGTVHVGVPQVNPHVFVLASIIIHHDRLLLN